MEGEAGSTGVYELMHATTIFEQCESVNSLLLCPFLYLCRNQIDEIENIDLIAMYYSFRIETNEIILLLYI